MTSETANLVRLERGGPIAVITVDRPEARNALTSAMRARLRALVEGLHDDRDLRCVLLRGAGGRTFVSGADIKEFLDKPDVAALIEQARADEELYRAIESLPAPVVAVIEGHALGGGLVLATACDLRICTSDSQFGVTSAKSLGNCLSPGGYARLVALIGPARTKELLIAAPVLSAGTAHGWGLVNEVVERDALEARLAELKTALAAHAPLTMWAAKEGVRRVVDGDSGGDDILERVLASSDFREGVQAFLGKRPPTWHNE